MTNGWFTGSVRFPEPAVSTAEALLAEGAAHLRAGRSLEAAAVLDRATAQAPSRPELWAMRAQALVGIDRSDEARACLERSLALDPRQPALWSNLAAIHLRGGSPEQGLAAAERALALRPDFAAARQNAALALFMLGRDGEGEALVAHPFERRMLQAHGRREAGDLEGAMAACREAIRLWEDGGGPARPVSPPRYSVEGGRAALLDAKARLDAAGIAFCLFAGTLLGIVRDGDLLPHDKDLDLGLAWDTDRARAVEAMVAGGLFQVPPTQLSLPQTRPYSRGLQHAATGCAVDLFFLEPDGAHLRCGLDNRPMPILSRVRAFGLRPLHWRGAVFQVPDPPEAYLAEIYGPDWRTPDPHFDTVLSNPVRLPEAVPMAVATSFFRLLDALSEGRLARARSLAEQIQLRQPDPFLAGLVARLGDRLAAGGRR